MYSNRILPSQIAPIAGFNPLEQDRGFAQMFERQVASGQQATPAAEAVGMSGVEQDIQQRWNIGDYGAIFNQPEQVMADHQDDFARYQERARQVSQEMARYDIQSMIDIRFGLPGVDTSLKDDFVLSDMSLHHLWRAEANIFEWSRSNHRLVDAIGGLGVQYAMAQSVLGVQLETGMTRSGAMASGQMDLYIQSVMLKASNTTGYNSLSGAQAGLGIDPTTLWSQQTGFDPRNATVAELRGQAQQLYQKGNIGVESLSLMLHAHELAGHAVAPEGKTNWLQVFEQLAGSSKLQGEARSWVHSTQLQLEALTR